MAAADTEIHSFLGNTIYSSLPLLVEEMSVLMRHGSFSFGRYADDSIAWEKRTVFSYDRRQEELEKIKALGTVAQKKANFDEFFKNVAHQQQTNQSGPSQDTKDGAKEEGNGTDAAVVEKERKLSNAKQIQIPDSLGILNNSDILPSYQEAKDSSTENNDATIKEGTNMVPLEDSFEEASVSHPPLPEGNPRGVEKKSIASGEGKETTNGTTQHSSVLKDVLKDKGNVVPAIKNKAKVLNITKDVGTKSKPNSSLCRQAIVKVSKSVISGKENTPNAVRTISGQITGSRSSLPRLSGPSKRGSLVSSSSSTSIIKTEAKPLSKRTKQKTELPVQIPRAKVTRLVSSSSISSFKKTEAKPSLKRTTQEKGLPVQIPSAQVTRLVSSSSSSSIRTTEAKPSLKRTRQKKEFPVQIPSTRVTRLVSSSSSSSIRKTEARSSSKRTNRERDLPEQIPSAHVRRLVSSSASSSTRKTEAKPSSKTTNQGTELPEKIKVLK
ncbi:uncharacterized protein DDB_G0271670-like [Hibiscus syriacus]|uniref:uncharacterized protein DDB_G0271670-like n=1 Tax=Hibiscus syriacus TaxID=106335 RepID=UPI0019213F8D|nr:uncharacterized protein DDB_G0271670-like [Hibiscus syriacus]